MTSYLTQKAPISDSQVVANAAYLSRMDEQHRAAVQATPESFYDMSDIPTARETVASVFASSPESNLVVEGVSVTEHKAKGLGNDPEVTLKMYKPENPPANMPALYWLHGGGLVMGFADMDSAFAKCLVKKLNIAVITVEYRLAPEHPYPAQIHDAYAGLKWLADHATQNGIDPKRIAVGGDSAGGTLTAGLTLMARDQNGPDIHFQLLIYPMLDDRFQTVSSRSVTHPLVWNYTASQYAWKAIIGKDWTPGDAPEIAAPAKAKTLAGLPPAYIAVGNLDMFVDESIAYAQALNQAGVDAELRVYPGAFHCSDVFLPEAPLSQRWAKDRDAALERAFELGA